MVIDETKKPVPLRRTRTKKSDNDYVCNADFTKALAEWVAEQKEKGHRCMMSNYLGECLLKMVNNYGHKRNYSGYSYLEDMKGEALLTCIKYLHNFDITKSENGFSYATQCIDNAFKIYLKREKTQQNIKFDIISDTELGKNNYKNIKLDSSDDEFKGTAFETIVKVEK